MVARSDACTHEDWQAKATVIRLTETEDRPITGWSVEFEMSCVLCLTPMEWRPMQLPVEQLVWAGGLQLRVPCHPLDVDAAGGTP